MAGYIGANTSSVTNNQNAAERRKKFTFTANTTVLSGLSFLPDKIHIFHNGIRLVKNTDFTEAADGQSVTLVNAAQAGDEIVAVTFDQNPAINTGSSYGDADVDAHLLTAGVTLDATNDRVGFGTATPSSNNGALSYLIELQGTNNNCITGTTDTSGMNGLIIEARDSTRSPQPRYAQIGMPSDTSGNGSVEFYTAAASGYVTKKLGIDHSGRVTTPSQPMFMARNTGNQAEFKQASNVYVNIGSHYNNTNGLFTAPVAGNYYFFGGGQSGAAGAFYWGLYKNGGLFTSFYNSDSSDTYHHASLAAVMPMSANDTCQFKQAGSVQMNTGGQNQFCGYLVG